MTVDLNGYLPRFYEDIREAQAILSTDGIQIDLLNADIDDVLAQFYVDTATWGLSRWETFTGFPVGNTKTLWDALEKSSTKFDDIENKSWDAFEAMFLTELDERRAAIKSRLRGAAAVTKETIINVCSAYQGGTVSVSEFPSEYKIIIEFIDTLGVPSNINTLKQVLGEIIPAHLVIEYHYRYLAWSDLDAFGWTWSDLDAKLLTYDELAVYKEG